MYIPISLGIATLASLLLLIIGQIITLMKIAKLETSRFCMMAGAGIAGAAAAAGASKAGWFKAAWEFIKMVGGKIKDKFKDKAADKIADKTVEGTEKVAEVVVAEEPKKT